jgi:hypothetical protein
MSRRTTSIVACLGFLACLSVAAVSGDSGARRAVDYFPLEVGTRWTYQVSQKDSKDSRLTVDVTDHNNGAGGSTYPLSYRDTSLSPDQQEDEPTEYTVRNEGISCEKCPGFVLRDPLTLDQSWQSGGDAADREVSTVVAVDKSVSVGPSEYKNCVVVRSQSRKSDRVAETTYAPNIGPVRVQYATLKGVVIRREDLLSVQRASQKPQHQ